MRKVSILFVAIVGLLAFSSCEKDEFGPVMSSSPGSPSIQQPQDGQSYALSEDQADQSLFTMEWSEPDYGFEAAVTYTVQMSKTGDNFADPISMGTTNGTSMEFTVGEMNNSLLANGFTAGQQNSLQFRVMASVSDSTTNQISDPVSLSITPYEVVINYPKIYVPGGFQSASGYGSDWTPADAPPLYSVESNDKYEGYVYMAGTGNEFKFTNDRSWDLNWGDTGADGTLDENGDNIVRDESGYYKINVDLNEGTYETLNTTWGLIGSATANGWDSDMDMTYDQENKVWTITTDLSAGEIKFRANNAWDLDYGDDGADGTLDKGGENIAIDEAGNYTIKLILSEPIYTYEIIKN